MSTGDTSARSVRTIVSSRGRSTLSHFFHQLRPLIAEGEADPCERRLDSQATNNSSSLRGLLAERRVVQCRPDSVVGISPSPPRVTVLMATFNRRQHTLRCLESLLQRNHQVALRVVLVDDCSSDGTAAAVRVAFPGVTVVNGSGELYWAGGMRVAFEQTKDKPYEYLLWLNDDVTLTTGAIQQLVQTERQLRPSRGPVIVVGALQDPTTGLTVYSGVRRRGVNRTRFIRIPPNGVPRRADTMNGNVVLVPSDVVERLGTFDPAFPHGIADYDYGLRAQSAGYEVWLAPNFVGECSPNPVLELTGTARENLRHVTSLKRIPPSAWLVFTRRHAGPLWPVFFFSPYVKAAILGILNIGAPSRRRSITSYIPHWSTRKVWRARKRVFDPQVPQTTRLEHSRGSPHIR